MKKLVGIIISDKMQGSAVVVVESAWQHPLYKKTVKRSKKYLVDNRLKAKTGQAVELTESRPLSAKKRFVITKILTK